MNHQAIEPLTNFLVLNSLSFFEKSRNLMEKHDQVNSRNIKHNQKIGRSF